MVESGSDIEVLSPSGEAGVVNTSRLQHKQTPNYRGSPISSHLRRLPPVPPPESRFPSVDLVSPGEQLLEEQLASARSAQRARWLAQQPLSPQSMSCVPSKPPIPRPHNTKRVKLHSQSAANVQTNTITAAHARPAASSPSLWPEVPGNRDSQASSPSSFTPVQTPPTGHFMLPTNPSQPQPSLRPELQQISDPELMATRTNIGVIQSLANNLEQDPPMQAYLCTPVDHFSQIGLPDVRYGCGYRNIQVMTAAMLKYSPHLRQLLFNGTGVPNVSSLQRWLEKAWQNGFDVEGAEQLGWSLLGTDTWIGSTDAAALLRFTGVDAVLYDFQGNKPTLPELQLIAAHMLAQQAKGEVPNLKQIWNYYGYEVRIPGIKVDPVKSSKGGVQAHCNRNKGTRTPAGKRLLAWVWEYFRAAAAIDSSPEARHSPIQRTRALPLYFQHQGHSQSIIGIMRRRKVAKCGGRGKGGKGQGARGHNRDTSKNDGSGTATISSLFGYATGTSGRVRGSGTYQSPGVSPQRTGLDESANPCTQQAWSDELDTGNESPRMLERAFHLSSAHCESLDWHGGTSQESNCAPFPNPHHSYSGETRSICAHFESCGLSERSSECDGAGHMSDSDEDDDSSERDAKRVKRARGCGKASKRNRASASTSAVKPVDTQEEWEDVLLVLDSQVSSQDLAAALESGKGWQKLMERPEHNLSMQVYQLLAVRGMLSAEQREASKNLSTTRIPCTPAHL